MARLAPASIPLPQDEDEPTNYSTTRHAADNEPHSGDDNENDSDVVEEEEEDSYCGSDIDQSTMILELATPTMMRTQHFDSPDNFILPQSDFEPEIETPSRRFFKAPNGNKSPTRSLASIFTKPNSQNGPDPSVFLHEGSPSTIAPADMHYALSGLPGGPSPYSQGMFGQTDNRSHFQGTLFQDYSPMKANDMMDEFMNFSPDKQQTGSIKTLPRTLLKSKSPRLFQDDIEPQSALQTPTGPRIFNGQSIRSVKKDSPSPTRIAKPYGGAGDTTLNFSKMRASPSPDPERSAKRVRSRSKSPVKNETIRPVLPSPMRESVRQISDDAYTMSKSKMDPSMKQEGRRRRETLEFRQFSREIRDFSAIKLSTLNSTRVTKPEIKTLEEEEEDEDDTSSVIPTVPSETTKPEPRKSTIRRRSCSAPPVPPIIEAAAPGTDRKPAPSLTESIASSDADKTRIRDLEIELAITRSKLKISQISHEETLTELKAHKIALQRAEDVIKFMSIETKFVLKATRAARPPQKKEAPTPFGKNAVYIKQEPIEDDNRSLASSRSINLSPRSARSNENRLTTSSRRAPGLTASNARPGYAATTKTREPFQRPKTTNSMYNPPSRAPARPVSHMPVPTHRSPPRETRISPPPRLITRTQTARETRETSPTTGHKRVLSDTNTSNVLNQRPMNGIIGYNSTANTLSRSKTGTGLNDREGGILGKPAKGPGGAVRPLAGKRVIGEGRRAV